MKRCTKCDLEKDISAFPKSSGKGGLSNWCRACHHDRYLKNKRVSEQVSYPSIDPIRELSEARVQKNVSLREISSHLGVNEITVGKWFNRKTMPRQKYVRAMYEFFCLDIPMILQAGDGGRLPLAVGECVMCGESFPIYKAGVKFCSRACSGKDLSSRQLGRKNAMWKGGEIVTSHAGGGYIKELTPNHPNADASGYVLQHRLVMGQIIGRTLEKHERVHHKNGDRKDNRPENLELWVPTAKSKKDPHGVRLVDQVIDMLSSLKPDELLQIKKAIEVNLDE